MTNTKKKYRVEWLEVVGNDFEDFETLEEVVELLNLTEAQIEELKTDFIVLDENGEWKLGDIS